MGYNSVAVIIGLFSFV